VPVLPRASSNDFGRTRTLGIPLRIIEAARLLTECDFARLRHKPPPRSETRPNPCCRSVFKRVAVGISRGRQILRIDAVGAAADHASVLATIRRSENARHDSGIASGWTVRKSGRHIPKTPDNAVIANATRRQAYTNPGNHPLLKYRASSFCMITSTRFFRFNWGSGLTAVSICAWKLCNMRPVHVLTLCRCQALSATPR